MSLQKIDQGIVKKVEYLHNRPLKSFSEDIYLITVYVAGLYYYVDTKTFDKEIKEKDSLDLFREPDNEHDEKAILVKFDGKKIGYVPRRYNLILANLMDAGKMLYGEVSAVDHFIYENNLEIHFKIYMTD